MIHPAIVALLQAGKFDDLVLHLSPFKEGDDASLLMPLGLALIATHHWNDAISVWGKLTQLQPDVASHWLNYGTVLQHGDQHDLAVAALEYALNLDPQNVTVLGNLAFLHWQKRDLPQVRHYTDRAAVLDPNNPDILNLQALALAADRQFEAAQLLWERALSVPPQTVSTAMLLANRANALVDERCFDKAEAVYRLAVQLGGLPLESIRNFAMLLLQMGQWQEGWALHEARLQLPKALPDTNLALWQGEDIAGKHIVVTSEQGLGDVLQFMRFVPMLAQRAGKLTLAVRKPLVELARQQGWCDVIDIADLKSFAADFFVPIMSLPLRLNVPQPESWPAAPYLQATASNNLPDNGRRKIGIVWAGSATNESDAIRSIDLATLEPLWQVDADFYPVFLHDTLNQITTQPLHRIDSLLQGFAATASILKELDLLITVDTSLCHLAGALGIPTILLLNYSGEWRWTADEINQPWYDRQNFTVLRQPKIGDWGSVIAQLIERLG